MTVNIVVGGIVDGKNGYQKKSLIVIEGDKIVDIFNINKNINKYINKSSNKTINAEKLTAMPGLIDAHVHVMMNPNHSPWADWTKFGKEKLLLEGVCNAKNLIYSGVTTARDCGALGDIGFVLRDAINDKKIEGPRLLVSGNPITITGGHCHYIGIEADNILEIKKGVRKLNKLNADFIKIMSTGGSLTPCSNKKNSQYSLRETKALTDEAHNFGKKVASHALGTKGIINSVKAGVDTIEHCAWLSSNNGIDFSESILEEMIEKNIFVNPTLPAAINSVLKSSANKMNLLEKRIQIMQEAHNSGLKIIAGTDAGVPDIYFDSIHDSIKLLSEKIGLSALEAILSATHYSAKALGISDRVGSIEKGKLADIILLEGNPLERLENTKNIRMVIKNGEIAYKNKMDL